MKALKIKTNSFREDVLGAKPVKAKSIKKTKKKDLTRKMIEFYQTTKQINFRGQPGEREE